MTFFVHVPLQFTMAYQIKDSWEKFFVLNLFLTSVIFISLEMTIITHGNHQSLFATRTDARLKLLLRSRLGFCTFAKSDVVVNKIVVCR